MGVDSIRRSERTHFSSAVHILKELLIYELWKLRIKSYGTPPKLYSILDLIIQAWPLHAPLSCLPRVRILLVRPCRLVQCIDSRQL